MVLKTIADPKKSLQPSLHQGLLKDPPARRWEARRKVEPIEPIRGSQAQLRGMQFNLEVYRYLLYKDLHMFNFLNVLYLLPEWQ